MGVPIVCVIEKHRFDGLYENISKIGQLVGRTDYCIYPPEAQSVPSIGGISNLNVEKIVSLNPDLVISGSMIPQKSSLQLEQMGVPIVCVI